MSTTDDNTRTPPNEDHAGDMDIPCSAMQSQLRILIASMLPSTEANANHSMHSDFFSDMDLSLAQVNAVCQRLRLHEQHYSALSIRDLIEHSNIADLARFLETFESSANLDNQKLETSSSRYIACAIGQVTVYASALLITSVALANYLPWLFSSSNFSTAFTRSFELALAWVIVGTITPLALKWALIGRWKAGEFPLWGWKYFRFWLVKKALPMSPLSWFPGTPLYNTYLRLLGADIAASAVLHLESLPICTDLLSVGPNTIAHQGSAIDCHKAVSGKILSAKISLSDNVSVGHGSRLEIGSTMESGSQLGHSSTLKQGDTVGSGEAWEGTPARATTRHSAKQSTAKTSFELQLFFSMAILFFAFLLPAAVLSASYLSIAHSVSQTSSFDDGFSMLWIRQCLFVAFSIGLTLLLISVLTSVWLPRLLRPLIQPGETLQRYGIRHLAYTLNKYLSNALPLHRALGDSIYIDDYLQSAGYHFDEHERSGLHFGLHLRNDAAHLNIVSRGVQAGSHLRMYNAVETPGSIALLENSLPPNAALGAHLNLPSDHKIGRNCRVAAFAMAPVFGKAIEHKKILGSPAIILPRQRLSSDPEGRQKSMLPAKNRHNLGSVFLYLASLLVSLCILVMNFSHGNFQAADQASFWASSIGMSLVAITAWHLFVEKASRPSQSNQLLHPYDPGYWKEERSQKLKSSYLDMLFVGTPMRTQVLRARGAKIGKFLYDEGATCSEPFRLQIADHCALNRDTRLQTDSELRDDLILQTISLANGVTLEPGCVINGAVRAEDGATIRAGAVLLGNETLVAGSAWSGNPASPVA